MNTRSYGIRHRRRPAARETSGLRHQGYTLLEMGLVITVMGTLILLMANHFATHVRPNDARVADKIVQDTWTLIHAARLWASRHGGTWPSTGGQIDLDVLGPSGDGYLAEMPTTPVSNPAGCGTYTQTTHGEYNATGWDRIRVAAVTSISNPRVTDLDIWFCVEGDRQFADSIVSRLPQARMQQLWDKPGQFVITTRLTGGAASRSSLYYVRQTDEDRPVVARGIDLLTHLATSDDTHPGDTYFRMVGELDVVAGVGIGTGSVERAFYDLDSITDTQGSFNKGIPYWKIRDRHSSVAYDGIWTLIGYEGETISGTTLTTFSPYAHMKVQKNLSDVSNMEWRLQYLYKDGSDPAVFDLYLTSRFANPSPQPSHHALCHRGIHAQLCEIERQVHNILDNATFNLSNTPAYTISDLEDPVCRSSPACPCEFYWCPPW